ncbi:acetyl-CoA C-acyltransferase family protein [Mameliella sediminis]|uniref:acetyl-CoA C-acyltransferase family protein n=1 Tax=Mameliella sediminis TaxID=2836866 RepID=UPI001C461757|nr:acetyl-CoA C-acyltransferase family protein [Mameliella sediminis]MBV7392655.1 acetyl-CoA C-acyltransferase family protein [Mameliella sediminis]
MTDVVILSGARTPIGTFGGALASETPTRLGAHVVRAALARAGLDPAQVGHVVMGHVINTEPKDMYLARVAVVEAGLPDSVPALTVNRLCGSGAQAIVSAAQHLMLGDADFAVAGGAEVMSRGPHALQSARWGQKMGDTQAVDMMVGALTDPFGTGHMGVTAENVAAENGITREEQDSFALESQRRAAAAVAAGHFDEQIATLTLKTRKGEVEVSRDEHIKADATAEGLAKLRPVFRKDGTVTAGNASGINDGAAALVLARAEAAQAAGLTPRARIVGYAHAGVRPEVMGIGPIPAVQTLMQKTGLTVADFDVVESNEAFAAQACAVSRALGFDPARVNPNGGAIALGHPIGATGAIITLKCLAELERTGGRHGLITMCIGGGQGIALAIERL